MPGAGEAWRAPGGGAGFGEGLVRKVNVDPDRLRQAQAEEGPESERLADLPLGLAGADEGPPKLPRRLRLESWSARRSRQPRATVSGLKPNILKCGAIADPSWVSSVFRGFPAGLEWRAEPPGALRGDRGEGVRTLQRVVMSPLWGSGAAPAGGRALRRGRLSPGTRPGAVGVSGEQCCSLLRQPGADPFPAASDADLTGGWSGGEVGAHIWRLCPPRCPLPELAPFSLFDF